MTIFRSGQRNCGSPPDGVHGLNVTTLPQGKWRNQLKSIVQCFITKNTGLTGPHSPTALHSSAPRHLTHTQAVRKYSNVMTCHGEYWLYCWLRYMVELQLQFLTWSRTPSREDRGIRRLLGTTSSWVAACRVLELSPSHSLLNKHKYTWTASAS